MIFLISGWVSQPLPGQGVWPVDSLKDSSLFQVELHKLVLLHLQLDTIFQRQLKEFASRGITAYGNEVLPTSRSFLEIYFHKDDQLIPWTSWKEDQAVKRPGPMGGVTIGMNLTKGLVQRLLLKGIHLPSNSDSIRIRYVLKDTVVIDVISYLIKHPGKNLFDLYAHHELHQASTFSQFQQKLAVWIRYGLIRIVEPPESVPLLFSAVSQQEFLEMIRKEMETDLVRGDKHYLFWMQLIRQGLEVKGDEND